MLLPTSESIVWMFAVTGSAYVLTALAVVVSRAQYDRRQRLMQGVERRLAASPHRAAVHEQVLPVASTAMMMRVVADGSASRAAQEVLATALVSRVGIDRLRRESSPSGPERNGWRRIAALRILALAQPDAAWPCLEQALADGGREVVAATVTMLGKIKDRRAAALLIQALRAGRHPRSRTATSLDMFPMKIAQQVMPLLADEDPQVQYWGARLMRRYAGTPGLEAELITLAGSPDAQVRKAAVETLGLVGGSEAIHVLRAKLTDPVPFVRAHAARSLGALRASAAVHAVLPLLADPDWWVRFAAKQSLQALGAEVAPAISTHLSHHDEFARNGAAEVLQNLGVFEELLAHEARGPADPDRVRTIHLLARAGGIRMWATMLGRLSGTAQTRARQLLAQADLGADSLKEAS
jgi:HEAT repeat protein